MCKDQRSFSSNVKCHSIWSETVHIRCMYYFNDFLIVSKAKCHSEVTENWNFFISGWNPFKLCTYVSYDLLNLFQKIQKCETATQWTATQWTKYDVTCKIGLSAIRGNRELVGIESIEKTY